MPYDFVFRYKNGTKKENITFMKENIKQMIKSLCLASYSSFSEDNNLLRCYAVLFGQQSAAFQRLTVP
jgi:hypothetical protein